MRNLSTMQLPGRVDTAIRVAAAGLTKGGSEQLQGWVGKVDGEGALAGALLQEGLQRWHPLGGEVSDDQVTDALQICPLPQCIHCRQKRCQEMTMPSMSLTHTVQLRQRGEDACTQSHREKQLC